MDAKLVCCNDIYIQNILEKLRCQPLGQRSSCTWDGGKVPGNMLGKSAHSEKCTLYIHFTE